LAIVREFRLAGSWSRYSDARRNLPQQIDLMPSQWPALARRKPLERNRPDGDSGQGHDLVSKLGEHSADLAFLALGQNQLELRGLSLSVNDSSALGADFALGKPNAFGQPRDQFRARKTGDEGAIDLLDAIARMCQPVCQLAVIGQDQEAGAILVQSADGVNALGDLMQEIDNPRASGGIRIGRDISLGFVDGKIDRGFESDWLAVNRDTSSIRIDPRAELPDHPTVHSDSALEDQLLATPPGSQAGVGEDFLEPLGLFRLGVIRFGVKLRLWPTFMSRGPVVPAGFACPGRMRVGPSPPPSQWRW
jgi:hypothetical protein